MKKNQLNLEIPHTARPIKIGFMALVFFLICLTALSLLVPIQSAAILPGKIIFSESINKMEHLEGGQVTAINKRSGDSVVKGEVIVEIENNNNKAQLKIYNERKMILLAKKARLKAEHDNSDDINFDELINFSSQAKSLEKIASESDIFKAKKEFYKSRKDILDKRISQLTQEISGAKNEIKSIDTQLKLIKEETDALKSLLEKQWIDKPKYLALKREAARLLGIKSERSAKISQLEQKIGETKTQLVAINQDQQHELLEEISSIEYELNNLEEKISIESRKVSEKQIVAPQDGVISIVGVESVGEVIAPGEVVVEVVPHQNTKLIEAQIKPRDIDVIKSGLTANIRLLPYKQSITTTVSGKIQSISPNVKIDPLTNIQYYPARIAINLEGSHYNENDLYLGMPVEVAVLTERRTLLGYLFEPFILNLERALV